MNMMSEIKMKYFNYPETFFPKTFLTNLETASLRKKRLVGLFNFSLDF